MFSFLFPVSLGLFTIYRGKPVDLRFMQMKRKAHVPFVQFALIYIESGTSLTIGVGLGTGKKSKWNTIFRLDIPVGNFVVPLKTFRLFRKFSVRANHNRNFRIFSVNGKHSV